MPEIINPFVAQVVAETGIAPSKIPVRLLPSYAQRSEDTIASGILNAYLYKQHRRADSVFYVEIGANHPIANSNTLLLREMFGGRGILVEADPALIAGLQCVRPWDTVVNAAISTSVEPTVTFNVANLSELSSVSKSHIDSFGDALGTSGVAHTVEVPNMHVNDLLAKYTNGVIDYLSVDCEGLDFGILKSLDFDRFKPHVVQCEPSDHVDVTSRSRMILFVESQNYLLAAMTQVNLIFVRN